jgi:hypothetical protein
MRVDYSVGFSFFLLAENSFLDFYLSSDYVAGSLSFLDYNLGSCCGIAALIELNSVLETSFIGLFYLVSCILLIIFNSDLA